MIPKKWHDYVFLGSGSHDFLRLIMPKLRHHVGLFIYANKVVFSNWRQRDLTCLYKAWDIHDVLLGLHSVTTTHGEFRGVTSACHMISFCGVLQDIFTPKAPLPRTLRHVLSDTTADAIQEISLPTPLSDPLPCAPIYVDGLMQQEGFFDLAWLTAHIACTCVFKANGWGRRTFSTAESLRAFNISPLMDAVLMLDRWARTLLQRLITPIVVTSICCNLWNTSGGLARGASMKQSLDEALTSDESTGNLYMETSRTDKDKDGITVDRKGEDLLDRHESKGIREQEKETTTTGDVSKGTMTVLSESKEKETEVFMEQQALLDTDKKEHGLAKAVKSDDLEVLKHLWDIAVCHGLPTLE